MFARRSSPRSDRSASAIASLVNRSKRSIHGRAAAPQGQGSLTKLVPLNHVDDHPEVLHVHRGGAVPSITILDNGQLPWLQ